VKQSRSETEVTNFKPNRCWEECNCTICVQFSYAN